LVRAKSDVSAQEHLVLVTKGVEDLEERGLVHLNVVDRTSNVVQHLVFTSDRSFFRVVKYFVDFERGLRRLV
jgi:hypothetical protein